MIYWINDSSTKNSNMAISSFSHLTNNLKLCWRTFFQVSCIESHINRCWSLIDFNKRIRTQNLLFPIFYKGFQTKITEHSHMSFIDNYFEKFKKLILSLREVFWCVETTTFPIKDNTVRMYFTNVDHHLFRNLILRISFICFDEVFNICWRSFIDKNSCSLLRLLFNSSK